MQEIQWHVWFLKKPSNLDDIKNVTCIKCLNNLVTSHATRISNKDHYESLVARLVLFCML